MKLTVDFLQKGGNIKPMHAVNNGPVYKFRADQRVTNMDAYRAAGIPYARNHDASLNPTYGGEHCVDVHGIFPCFDADPYDPASYDFVITDEYLKVVELAGTETFYRLGCHIEHWPKKYNTLPPKDFQKWAVICEHIIRHYNEGWADGFHMNLQYWEIWNEPDLGANKPDPLDKLCWGGTKEQFFELYDITARHLKQCFPSLKIGGPALAGDAEWAKEFLTQCKAPLDFFSWHCYTYDPKILVSKTDLYRNLLDETGFFEAESILNEWNYIKGWTGDDWIYSLKQEKSIKGAAFIAAVMCACQYTSLDMLMYYDARPCGMNGMFCTDFVCECLKGYYPFKMFSRLYQLGDCVLVNCDDEKLYGCAAVSNQGTGEAAVMISYYDDDDQAEGVEVEVSLQNLPKEGTASLYLLDGEHDMGLIRTEVLDGTGKTLTLPLPLFGTYLIDIQ